MRDIRKDYSKGVPIVIERPNYPLELLENWINDAISEKVTEPNAMNIATIDKDGKPRNRMVLIKHLTKNEIGFFTNKESDKGKELRNCPYVSCTIWWPEMERQVRIEGIAKEMGVGFVEDYHSSRPRMSQIAAWASLQSEDLDSRDVLLQRFQMYEEKFESSVIPVPPFWGGYVIDPTKIEYWEGRPSRLHDRVLLTKSNNGWEINRLYP
tara:strand:- start:367 stop:996 length:630 start_codon:yes stop_codon:yes gene_type:complete